ncbi:MAG TPA: RNA methyltransferase [Pyrinomonadaceae bacterium]
MTREAITSRKNPLVQRARAARDGRERDVVFAEGVRLCEEALRAGVGLELVLYARTLAEDGRGRGLLEKLREACPAVHLVAEDVLDSVSDTKTPQGVVALARRPPTGRAVVESAEGVPLVVIIHRANNPSNAGAMLRVAEAAGATGVVLTKGSTDPLSAKSLRGSMGSAFRLPLWTGPTLAEALGWCAARGIRTAATAADARAAHTEVDWTLPRAVVVGPEAGGLSEEEARAADEGVRIPMRASVESLNVAVALAVVLYEAARQRGFRPD